METRFWRKTAPRVALDAYYLVSGRGGGWLGHKQQYHERRAAMEREFLAEARLDPSLLRARRCPACGGERVSERFANEVGFSFARCAGDGTVYMDPAPTEEMLGRLYNDPAESFKHLGEELENNTRVTPRNEEDLEAILRMAPPELRGGRLLDVGCAKGAFLLTARRAFEVAGVELNGTTAQVARANGLHVVTGRLSDVPGSGEYSVVTMLQLIEHIADPRELLLETRRLLAPGGVLYLNTPAIDSASFEYLRESHTHVASFAHVSLFSRRALATLADRAGFELIAHEHCGGMDLSLADITTRAIFGGRFRHRMAMYRPRLYYACDLLEQTPAARLKQLLAPPGNQSYQRAILQLRAGPAT